MTQPWIGFTAPADPKALPEQQLEQLQPLYAAMIKQQANALLGHLVIP
jgi:myo-inositol catabolism protein IolC